MVEITETGGARAMPMHVNAFINGGGEACHLAAAVVTQRSA